MELSFMCPFSLLQGGLNSIKKIAEEFKDIFLKILTTPLHRICEHLIISFQNILPSHSNKSSKSLLSNIFFG